MSYIIRILIIISLFAGIFLIISSIEEKSSILVENTSASGILFMNGLFQPGDSFCFTPESSSDYNIALVSDDSRENIQVSKTNQINISKSEGDSLGLNVSKISLKTLEKDDRCN